jgi:hypothetical protein
LGFAELLFWRRCRRETRERRRGKGRREEGGEKREKKGRGEKEGKVDVFVFPGHFSGSPRVTLGTKAAPQNSTSASLSSLLLCTIP